MDPRSMLHAEIDGLTDEQLVAVAAIIREIKSDSPLEGDLGFLERMMEIQIDAPADFSMQVVRNRHGVAGDE